jgi:predicted ATP-grasp superfamily ATP-dependent carboligase
MAVCFMVCANIFHSVRILVHEFVSGGGLAGRDVPASLGREGRAMLAALVADLRAIGSHKIVVTVDSRFPLAVPPGVEMVTLSPVEGSRARLFDALLSSLDAVWLVAPETDRCLERLAARAERKGIAVLGSCAAAIRMASDKARLPRLLAQHGVSHPATRVIDPSRVGWKAELDIAARALGYPLVVKPARGAGCEGVSVARDAGGLRHAAALACRTEGRGPLVLQRYVRGVAASVSLLADGCRAVALTTNGQSIQSRGGSASRPFAYGGGTTPLDHPLAGLAGEQAVRVCQAIPGLRGYVGVDLMLTDSEAFVIEVNPRLTTAYLGVRSALDENVAAMVIAACDGTLPELSPARRHVRFTARGRITRSGFARSRSSRSRY